MSTLHCNTLSTKFSRLIFGGKNNDELACTVFKLIKNCHKLKPVTCHKKSEYLNLLKIKHVMIVLYSKFQYRFAELTQEIALALHLIFSKCFMKDIPLKNSIT
jgi:hypothetical protein